MVNFTTGLTGWVERSRSSVLLISCIVCVGIVRKIDVGVRVCLTIIISVVISNTDPVFSYLVFFLFSRLS